MKVSKLLIGLFAGALSRKTSISCETRGGITGTLFASPLAIYLARLAMVDDQLAADELHLLRLQPLAWLHPGAVTTFTDMPTEFGPVSVQTQVSADGTALDITVTPRFRRQPAKLLLHIPPLAELTTITLNGQALAAATGDVIEIGAFITAAIA